MKLKNYLLFMFSSLFLLSTAQIPTGYYDSANGLSGAALKTKLSTIITNGHVDKGYAGLWTAYKTTDIDKNYENDGSILDIYSENPSGADPYKFTVTTSQCGTYSVEGDCYNREHIIPQSLFNQASPMVSDLHHIRATDGKVNGMRSNYPFGKVGTATWTSRNGGKLGNSVSSGYTGTVFEPIDAFKGDVARMIFYFVTRYESKLSGFTSGNILGSSTYPGLQTWELNVLLQWNSQDPVSQEEINRNNASYTFQGNRNPFIDRPEYVTSIWGGTSTSDTTAPSIPASLVASNITSTSATVSWAASTDNVGISGYKIFRNGTQVGTSTSTSYSLTGLTAGTAYSITVQAYDAAGNSSASSTPLSFTTTSATTFTELYFSEYLEGSSNNKALEISNRTSTAANLSIYSIKKQVNGSSTWTTVATLSGSLPANTTYVIAHSSYALTCTGTINLKTSNLDFNGNDAVGLFKNGVLIDMIGANASSAVFAQDVTLRRNVSKPRTTYLASEWTSYAIDTCSNIGTVNPTGTARLNPNTSYDLQVKIYPNPSKNNEIFFSGNQLEKIENVKIYDMNGKLIQSIDSPFAKGNRISLAKLSKGVYWIMYGTQSQKIVVE